MIEKKEFTNIEKTILKEMIYDWLEWLRTRRFYAPPPMINILARMQKLKELPKEPPDAKNSLRCQCLNLVIQNLSESERIFFLYVYLKTYRPSSISSLAKQLGVHKDTIYTKAHDVAIKVYSRTLILERRLKKMSD